MSQVPRQDIEIGLAGAGVAETVEQAGAAEQRGEVGGQAGKPALDLAQAALRGDTVRPGRGR